jgi:CheY-like chemotaxis protein
LKSILVVDDEPVLREILRDILEEAGFKVLEAEGGTKAFSLIQKEQFDCLISDIRMPLGSGIDLIRNLSEWNGKKPKIILMTAYGDIGWEEAKRFNVSKIISKPFEPASIVREVQAVLKEKA